MQFFLPKASTWGVVYSAIADIAARRSSCSDTSHEDQQPAQGTQLLSSAACLVGVAYEMQLL